MPGPLPAELRERVIEALDNGEGTLDELAARFLICPNSILEWRRLRDETGSLHPRPMGGARPQKKCVEEEGEAWIRDTLREKPALTNRQLVALYQERFGLDIHVETMRSTVRRLGFTLKKGLFDPLRPGGPPSSRPDSLSRPR